MAHSRWVKYTEMGRIDDITAIVLNCTKQVTEANTMHKAERVPEKVKLWKTKELDIYQPTNSISKPIILIVSNEIHVNEMQNVSFVDYDWGKWS